MNRAERDALALHLWFAVLAAVVLLIPADVADGVRMAFLVAAYVVAVPSLAAAKGHREWYGMWAFALMISGLLVFVDRFLVEVLGVLEYRADGLADIGSVTGYMLGLYLIPLFVVLVIGRSVDARQGGGPAYVAVFLTSLLLFVGAEQWLSQLPAWRPVGVTVVGHVALYLVPAKLLLGLGTYYAFVASRGRWALVRVPIAIFVMWFYFGAVVFSWFAFERLL